MAWRKKHTVPTFLHIDMKTEFASGPTRSSILAAFPQMRLLCSLGTFRMCVLISPLARAEYDQGSI